MPNHLKIPILVVHLGFIAMGLLCSNLTYAQSLIADDIRKSFNDYKSAILATNGNESVKYVDQTTITYYEDILAHSLNADSLQMDQMDIVDKLVILMIRQTTDASKLEEMNGKTLFVHAVDNGMIAKNSVQNNSIGKVEVDSAYAKAFLVSNGQATQSAFDYYLEDGQWKINLTSIFPEAEAALTSVVKSSGKSENDYLMMVLTYVTGQKPKTNIWQPSME